MIFALAWEAIARFADVSHDTMPGAFHVLVTMGVVAIDPVFLAALGQTLWSALLGLLISLAIGVPLGLLLGLSAATYRAAGALIDILRPIPSVALIPAAVLIFGPGIQMQVALVVFSIVWTVLLNTIYAVRDTDPVAKDAARVFGFNRAQTTWHIVLPHAAPFIYTSVRIGAVGALLVTVASELLTAGGGLGEWLAHKQEQLIFNDQVYAGALLAGVVGVLINVALDRGEKRMFSWHASVRGETKA